MNLRQKKYESHDSFAGPVYERDKKSTLYGTCHLIFDPSPASLLP